MTPQIIICTVPGCFGFEAPGKSAVIDADETQRKRFEVRSRPQEEHPIIIG